MERIGIVGTGITPFGILWDRDPISLTTEAITKAIYDSNLTQKDIQALYLGSLSTGLFTDQVHYASAVADFAGLKNVPSTRVEAACTSGSLALKQACYDIMSGQHDIIIAMGVEKMTDIGNYALTRALAKAASYEWDVLQGATFPGIFAMVANRHMHQYGTTREQLAMVAVKNHKNGAMNPHAQFQKEVSIQDVLNSPPIADPLNMLDCTPVTDGAAAVVVAREEIAKKLTDTPIWIAGRGHATDTLSLHDRQDITTFQATVHAARRAFREAKMTPKDIDCCEVHDCFTIAEICAIEDIGFCKKGEGGRFTEEGCTQIGGQIPINTSGGLKAKGHPVGASGISQIIEAVLQLRGEAGKRNTGAEVAMTHNIGGSGGSSICHIFTR